MYNGIYLKEQYAYLYDTLTKWLKIKTESGSLGKRLLEKEIRKIAIYGVNGLGELVFHDIKDSGVEAVCFIDKNADHFRGRKSGLAVLNPRQLEQLPEDCYVLVTPEYYFCEIMTDLLDRGILLERIISLSMIVG